MTATSVIAGVTDPYIDFKGCFFRSAATINDSGVNVMLHACTIIITLIIIIIFSKMVALRMFFWWGRIKLLFLFNKLLHSFCANNHVFP